RARPSLRYSTPDREGHLLRRIALIAALAAAPTLAQGKGEIDWNRRVLIGHGHGAPDLNSPSVAVARLGSERAAKLGASRNRRRPRSRATCWCRWRRERRPCSTVTGPRRGRRRSTTPSAARWRWLPAPACPPPRR